MPMPARWDWPPAAPLEVTVGAVPTHGTPDWKSPTFPKAPVAREKVSERTPLIPYDCTKSRISMFPATAEAEYAPPHE